MPESEEAKTSDEYLVHFMKLEVVWILTNLLYGDSTHLDCILGISPLNEGLAKGQGGFDLDDCALVRQLDVLLRQQMDTLS